MSAVVTQAVSIAAPLAAADSTGLTGVVCVDTTTSSQSITIPTQLRKKFVTIQATSADCKIAFGAGSAPTVTPATRNTFASPSALVGFTIPAGQARDFKVPANATHLSYANATGSGTLEIYCSETFQA